MVEQYETSNTLWLLKGSREVPGWGPLEADAKSGKAAVVIFDRGEGWALIRGDEAPEGYDGMTAVPPRNGLYVSEHGYPIYIVDRREVRNAKAVIDAQGEDAKTMFEELKDADAVLQRMGLAY